MVFTSAHTTHTLLRLLNSLCPRRARRCIKVAEFNDITLQHGCLDHLPGVKAIAGCHGALVKAKGKLNVRS